jgi:hypothetical protein
MLRHHRTVAACWSAAPIEPQLICSWAHAKEELKPTFSAHECLHLVLLPHRPYKVLRHVIGRPASEDVVVYEEKDESFYVSGGMSISP